MLKWVLSLGLAWALKKFTSVTSRFGSWPARRVTWSLVILFSVWVLLDVLVLRQTSGLARSSYDGMVRSRVLVAPPDPRIVIIDIDEASLLRMGKDFGRWPWPRDTLATVLDFIEKQAPAAIAWDVIFSDADRLNPGGDTAFNEAVGRSRHSHFAVVRLPAQNDTTSQLTPAQLPGLWSRPPAGGRAATPVALIAPVLPAVAAAPLGFNNGYADSDGVLRRYRFRETLADGSQLRSMAASVADAMAPGSAARMPAEADALMVWRKQAQAYPRISFADVFAVAEGEVPLAPLPSFAGKVIVIGATAASLYDIHPTPLSSMQAGVETLATALDNAINQRYLAELPRWLQAGLAVLVCVGLALRVQIRGVDSLGRALLVLPATLLGLSYLSLNGFPVFLDLHIVAGLALLFLTVMRYWSAWRKQHWCSPPRAEDGALALWPWVAGATWNGVVLDRVFDVLERDAPACRLMVHDTGAAWPGSVRWPELAHHAAVVGPRDQLLAAQATLAPAMQLNKAAQAGAPVLLPTFTDRSALADACLAAWSTLKLKALAPVVTAAPPLAVPHNKGLTP